MKNNFFCMASCCNKVIKVLFLAMVLGSFYHSFAAQQELPAQAQAFFDKLAESNPDLLSGQVEFYYKKLDSIVSRPDGESDAWSLPKVMFSEKVVTPDVDGNYRLDGISFTMKEQESFDPTKEQFLTVTSSDGQQTCQRCVKDTELKELYVTRIESYSDLVSENFAKKACWRQRLKLKAIVRNSSGKAYNVTIERVSNKNNPVKVNGMAVIYDKERERTEIHFEYCDLADQPVTYFDPVFVYKHTTAAADKKIFRVLQHKLFLCDPKDIKLCFSSPASRQAWNIDQLGFYDLKKERVLDKHLSGCYSADGSRSEVPCEPLIWVFGEEAEHDALYALSGNQVLEDKNDYIYSPGDGSLSATLQYKEEVQEFFAEHNKISLHCLERVVKPSLSIHKSVVIAGGHQIWPVGMYQRIRSADKIVWQRIQEPVLVEIEQMGAEIPYEFGLNSDNIAAQWKSMSPQESKKWCNAAQKFFSYFDARIYSCNQDLLSHCKTWTNVRELNLSKLVLDDKSLTKPKVLEVVGQLEQLRKFDFTYNNSITDFNENYTTLADRCTAEFFALAVCIGKLKKLQELHIYGLWLKPESLLKDSKDSGELDKRCAILTGIINHQDRKGVTEIINNICNLPDLKILFIDSIPADGSSFAARWGWSWPTTIAFGIFTVCDAMSQYGDLSKLCEKSAQKIAKMPSLQKVNICSTGGAYQDYFSTKFKDHLIKSRPESSPKYEVTSYRLS